MEKVHIERLRSLYSMMAGMPSQLVYMNVWRTKGSGRGQVGLSDEGLIQGSVTHLMNDPNHSCGTAACALGWSAAYPEFKEAGFTTDQDGWPRFDGKTGFGAGQRFFGLTYLEASALFNVVREGDAKQVFLERLRTVLIKYNIITLERNSTLVRLEREQAEKDKVATYVMVPQAD